MTGKKGGRPTQQQIVERKANAIKRARYDAQEAKRAERVQIDQKIVLVAWIVGVALAFLTSAVISFNGITSVAPLVGLPAPWMGGLFFFFIEFMYVLFLVGYLVLSSRIDTDGNDEKVWGTVVGMWFFAGVAILANAYHTLTYHDWDIFSPDTWGGIVLSVAAPIAILSVSKLASRIVFAKSVRL